MNVWPATPSSGVGLHPSTRGGLKLPASVHRDRSTERRIRPRPVIGVVGTPRATASTTAPGATLTAGAMRLDHATRSCACVATSGAAVGEQTARRTEGDTRRGHHAQRAPTAPAGSLITSVGDAPTAA